MESKSSSSKSNVNKISTSSPSSSSSKSSSPSSSKSSSTSKSSSKSSTSSQIKRVSKSERAGLVLPVARVKQDFKRGKYSERTSDEAAVYLTSVIEYLVAETLELSGKCTQNDKRKRINPRDIQLAVRNDEEIGVLLSRVVINHGGVIPNIHSVLLPNAVKESYGEQSKHTW